jgi:large subunit ribosomal protein L28
MGHHIRHKASGRWERKATKKPREWHVNVQRKRVLIDGRYRRANICTRCIRTLDRRA